MTAPASPAAKPKVVNIHRPCHSTAMQRRPSNRYPGHDYAEPGAYFVTVCIQGDRLLLGKVVDGEIELSAAGTMVAATLAELPAFIPGIAIDTFVVMPNHVHALLFLGTDPRLPVDRAVSLGALVGQFKTLTTNRYIEGVRDRGWPRFDGRLWQRNYHDHIVRSDHGVDRVRAYIEGNPARWQQRLNASAGSGTS